MVKTSSLNKLRTLDLFQVCSNIASHLQKYDLVTLKLQTVATEFQQALTALDEALKPLRISADTQKLNELDARRDRALVGLSTFLKSFVNFPDANKADAAVKLKAELDKYGKSPQTLPLREETAMITNVLQDFEKSENAPLVTELGATGWVNELKTANTEFEQLYNSRTQEKASIEVGKTKEARRILQDAFGLLVKTINARQLLDGEESYKPLADELNYEVKQAKISYK